MRLNWTITIFAAALLTGCATPPPATPVQVKILAINDFHGNLKAPQGGIRIKDPADPTKTINVPAGGAEQLATAVAELRAKNPNHIFVAAGDLVGATPAAVGAVPRRADGRSAGRDGARGQRGRQPRVRQGRDRAAAHAGRRLPARSTAARGRSRSRARASGTSRRARSIDASGKTLLPAYYVKRFQGIPVAFIGLTLKDTPTIVVPAGVAGLTFRDEAQTVNALVPELRHQGIEAIVVLIHEGGMPTGDYNECPGISGPIVEIVKKLDKAVDLVISGHTHRAYNCRIDGRLVTSADKYGTIVTQIDLILDPKTGDVIDARGRQRDRAHRPLREGPDPDRADRGLREARGAAGQARGRPHRRAADCSMPARPAKRRSAR